MKRKITLFLVCLHLLSNGTKAQITIDTKAFNWSKIENGAAPAALVYNDGDNGDGLNDGAMLVKATANTPAIQGLQYLLAGSPLAGEQINLELKHYQYSASYVVLKMQVYNVTDGIVLAQTAAQGSGPANSPATTTLSYTFTESSVGDEIVVRIIRADDLNVVRISALDYLKVNGQLISMQVPPAEPVNFDVTNFNWSRIENVSPPVALVYNDADNGDGLNDGAMLVRGSANTPSIQGLQYLLTGSPFKNGKIDLEVKHYQYSSSYVVLKMQVYNVTDDVVLAESAAVGSGPSNSPATTTLSYIFTSASVGDQIAVRFVRADDLNVVRISALDYVKVNGQFVNMEAVCKPTITFDLPQSVATASEINDLKTIRNNLSDLLLGTTAPSATELSNAVDQYNALNISVIGTKISGNEITVYTQVAFLRTFARHLKFNPNDTEIIEKAMKTIWYVSSLNCAPKSNAIMSGYAFATIARPAIFLNNYLPDNVKDLFGNTLQTETFLFQYLFDPNYDFNTTLNYGAISTDVVYVNLDVLLAYADWFKTNDDKIRYLKTAKRFIERFLMGSQAKTDGIKKDGLGFHHGAAYDGYMYAYATVANVLKSLEDTSFQIDQQSYFVIRDAVYAQTIYSNDVGVRPLSMAGRHPESRLFTLSASTLSNLAITGGKILGLNTADPVLAGVYNRRYGVNSKFNYSTITPFEEGYVQFNYGNLGVYRKNNWVASMKGESNLFWGSEIYVPANRFGRYQSYGALEIMYPGNFTTGNGFSDIGWDWNYNPGTTTIVLPWSKLHAEKERVDEGSTYGFAGALALKQANKAVLSKTMGESGLFAMKFKENSNPGFGIVYGPNTHNPSFEFTKTYFSIDDYIICLGTGIKNDDTVNPTVTTLFQRLNNNSNDVLVNGEVKTNQSTESFEGTSANWIIDNYNTGYYILPNSGALKIRNSLQITPYQSQVNPSDATIATNNGNNYHLAYLDHGTAPINSSYEYVCIPSANAGRMTQFSQEMQTEKPFTVYQNNTNQQIIEHKASKTWAYALPATNSAITDGLVKANDTPCLVMYKALNGNYSEIVLSVSNPDMGVNFAPKIITLTLNSEWTISQGNSNANIGSATAEGTTIAFTLAQGLPVEIQLKAVNPCALPNATPIAPALELTQPTCSTATGSIKVSGLVENLSFGLDGATFENTTGLFENVTTGMYNVYAKNGDGCISAASSAVINVQPATPDAATLEITQPTYTTATGSIQVTSGVANLSFGLDGVTFDNTSGVFENLASGDYTVYTKSADGCISMGTIAIINPQPVAPTVAITSPINNSSDDALASITITADAADADGSVSKVEFFNGVEKLGEDIIAPYSFTWNNVASGFYSITAKATDNDNAVTTSEVININVVCPAVQLSIPDVYAMNPSIDDKNTIYLGYGPTAVTLNALMQGGQNVVYNWSTGATGSSTSVSQEGTYTVTASYAGGCQSTASTTVNVVDVRCGQNNDKVMICHNNNVICVAQSAVQQHLNHGDNLGSCSSTSKMTGKVEVTDTSAFAVYPNPVLDSFNVSIASKLDPNATIGIYNILGNKIRSIRLTVVPQNVYIYDLPSGNYIVVVQNGIETFRSTIVKQ